MRIASSAEILDVLRDGGTLELLLRLLRGKPRTIERIREFAPGGIDLGASLTALERVGLIRIEPDGLRIEAPVDVVVAAVTHELDEQRRGLARWRSVMTSFAESSAQAPMLGGTLISAGPPTDGEQPPSLRFTPADTSALWDQEFAADGQVRAAIPDLGRARARLLSWLGQPSPSPSPASLSLLLPVRTLLSPPLRSLVQQLAEAGVPLRLASGVPTWLLLAPGRPVVLSVAPGDRPLSGTIATGAPMVVAGLSDAYDSWWRQALPYPLAGNLASRGLALRSQGLSDDEVAGVLDVSPRTLQRHLETLMRAIGARSRFELGCWWARHRDDATLFTPDPVLEPEGSTP